MILRQPFLSTVTTVPLQPADIPDASGSGMSLNGDGSCAVGHQDAGPSTPFHAFRWTEASGPVDLGTLNPANDVTLSSFATDTDRSCSVVVGFSDDAAGLVQHAFLWTAAAGMTDLGAPGGPSRASRALGTNADGSVVVGDGEFADASAAGGFRRSAFRWTGPAGFQDVGVLEPGSFSLATAVSADGSVVVGQGGVTISAGASTISGSSAFL